MSSTKIPSVRRSLLTIVAVVSCQQMVFGHHAETMQGNPWLQGLSMPLHGLDHMLMAIGVGLIAVQLGGRALWMVPLGFSLVLVGGGLLNLSGFSVPLLEQMILVSLFLAAAQLGIGFRVPVGLIVTLFSLLAVFHGQALIGPVLAGGSWVSLLAFTGGCMFSSLLLVAAGVAMGWFLRERARAAHGFRFAGAALLFGSLLIVLAPESNGWLVGILEGLTQ